MITTSGLLFFLRNHRIILDIKNLAQNFSCCRRRIEGQILKCKTENKLHSQKTFSAKHHRLWIEDFFFYCGFLRLGLKVERGKIASILKQNRTKKTRPHVQHPLTTSIDLKGLSWSVIQPSWLKATHHYPHFDCGHHNYYSKKPAQNWLKLSSLYLKPHFLKTTYMQISEATANEKNTFSPNFFLKKE